MPDHFAALSQPRRPWLDPDSVKEAFHRLAAQHHPDTAPGTGDDDRFAALNAAQTALREPALRLRHLLELEAPDLLSRAASIPPALVDLFMSVAGQRHALDVFRKKQTAATAPLARALLAAEKNALRREIERTLAVIEAAQDTALAELRALDQMWPARTSASLENLAALQARLAFLAKWIGQLREDLFGLGG